MKWILLMLAATNLPAATSFVCLSQGASNQSVCQPVAALFTASWQTGSGTATLNLANGSNLLINSVTFFDTANVVSGFAQSQFSSAGVLMATTGVAPNLYATAISRSNGINSGESLALVLNTNGNQTADHVGMSVRVILETLGLGGPNRQTLYELICKADEPQADTADAPEPRSFLLAGFGLIGLALAARKRRSA